MASSSPSKETITLVTGGNEGIGLELVSQLLATPITNVLLGSGSRAKGEAFMRDLQTRGLPGTVDVLPIDIADEQSIEQAAKQVEDQYGRLDALVNNAASD